MPKDLSAERFARPQPAGAVGSPWMTGQFISRHLPWLAPAVVPRCACCQGDDPEPVQPNLNWRSGIPSRMRRTPAFRSLPEPLSDALCEIAKVMLQDKRPRCRIRPRFAGDKLAIVDPALVRGKERLMSSISILARSTARLANRRAGRSANSLQTTNLSPDGEMSQGLLRRLRRGR